MQLSVLNSYIVYQKGGGQKPLQPLSLKLVLTWKFLERSMS